MDSIIRIENLIFEYKKSEDGEAVRAINDISLSVEKGSFTAIQDMNGSRK